MEVSPQFVLDLYEKEEKFIKPIRERQQLKQIKKEIVPKSIITPKSIRTIIILLIVAAFLTYLALEINKIVSPPSLEIISPANNQVVKERTVEIVGKSEPETTVMINNQEVFSEISGDFESKVELKEGLNTIKITAQKKRSRETVVYLNILFESENK